MLIRIVLFLGIALVLLAGGAAGYQYAQANGITLATLVASDAPVAEAAPEAAPAEAKPPEQNWLITPGGGLVDRATVAAYLWQDRLAERRVARLSLRAPLTDLLSPGEALPGPAYLVAFADIRAQVLADKVCAGLTEGFATRCEMVSAAVDGESLDAAAGTARFEIAVAYAQAVDAQPLPDLSTVVLREDYLMLQIDESGGRVEDAALLSAALTQAQAECGPASPDRLQCRILAVSAGRDDAGIAQAQVYIAWLAPMPPGLYPAPPLN